MDSLTVDEYAVGAAVLQDVLSGGVAIDRGVAARDGGGVELEGGAAVATDNDGGAIQLNEFDTRIIDGCGVGVDVGDLDECLGIESYVELHTAGKTVARLRGD